MTDDRRLYHPDSVYVTRWVTCRCGKEREASVRDFPELAAKRLDLAEHTMCRSCSQKFGREMDSCPESLSVEGGVSGCSLPFEHEGRCQPYEFIRDELIKHLGRDKP